MDWCSGIVTLWSYTNTFFIGEKHPLWGNLFIRNGGSCDQFGRCGQRFRERIGRNANLCGDSFGKVNRRYAFKFFKNCFFQWFEEILWPTKCILWPADLLCIPTRVYAPCWTWWWIFCQVQRRESTRFPQRPMCALSCLRWWRYIKVMGEILLSPFSAFLLPHPLTSILLPLPLEWPTCYPSSLPAPRTI